MKDLTSFIKESLFGIDPSVISLLILTTGVTVSNAILGICLSTKYTPSSYNPTIKERIQRWLSDRKTKKIIDRLSEDKDVQDFLKQPNYKQKTGWRDLLKSKLSEDELKYIALITKSKFDM